jgi:O-antigen ligase
LEATRHFLYLMKDGTDLPPGMLNDPAYLKRIASPRIFSTFSNPDALAGAIVLLLPVALVFLWQITPKVRTAIRWAFVAILGGCGLACLYWSGSKAGWLVTLIVAMVALGHSSLSVKWKRILICGVLIFGVAGFGVRYAAFFKKQKNSVGARFTYWQAAFHIVAKHPMLGTGPGTFGVLYGQIKRPDDEMARLCHNDYVEQACDSGLPGFVAYTAMIAGYLSWLYRYRAKSSRGFSCCFVVWLGMMGLCLHSVVEYHLYIPALAWPMFFLLGWAMNFED